jgi:hypothetical protein
MAAVGLAHVRGNFRGCAPHALAHQPHLAFFDSREEQNKILRPFFKDGYDRGEKLFHVVDVSR